MAPNCSIQPPRNASPWSPRVSTPVVNDSSDRGEAGPTLASAPGQMVWLLRHANRVHCNHGGRRERRNLCHGGCHRTSSRTRPLIDVDGKHSAPLGGFCVCDLLFNVNHGRAYSRAPWTRISWWLDRAIWIHHSDAAR